MKKSFVGVLLFLFATILVSGCSNKESSLNGNSNDNGSGNSNGNEDGITYTIDTNVEGEINFWSWDTMFEDVIVEFNKVYPNVKVNLTVMDIGELHDKLQTTINSGSGAPDVSHVDNVIRYGEPGLLEDLSQPPYNAERYAGTTSDYIWERWKSLDGKRLLAVPWDITPGVFYYRPDLYEQAGLPSDPEELGEFLQDKDNVLTAGQTLAANDIYMFEFRDTPAVQYGDAIGYFDKDFNYTRNDERMIELLDFVKQGSQIGWAPQKSVIFDDEGVQLLKQGRVASFPAGTQFARAIADVVPEQSGKWSVTRMPLDTYVGLSGSTFVIPSQTTNKEASWAFTEWISRSEEAWKIYVEKGIQPAWGHITSLPWYQEMTNEFLGGIQAFKFYDTLTYEIPVRRFTPFDGAAWPLYIDKVNEAIDNNIDSRTILSQIEDNTLKQLGPDIEKLKEEMANW